MTNNRYDNSNYAAILAGALTLRMLGWWDGLLLITAAIVVDVIWRIVEYKIRNKN